MEVRSEKDRLMQLRRRVEEEEANLTVNHISLCTDILGCARYSINFGRIGEGDAARQ